MGRPAAFLLMTVALAGCSTVEQFIPGGTQVLTITPNGGASYQGRCFLRGAEPVTVAGDSEQSWDLASGIDCRIVQKGSGSLLAEVTGPDGVVTRSQTSSDGALISIAQQ
jgi:hypothetical protein